MSQRLYTRLFWPDTHCPIWDKSAVRVAMDIAQALQPDELVFLGDFQDCASISFHPKAPEVDWQSLKAELEPGKALLHEIVAISGAKSVVYIEGNHEARITRYINKFSPKLHGILHPPNILGIGKGWKYYPYGHGCYHKCGNSGLIATHGSLCGVNPARRMLTKYNSSIIFGHTHKLQVYYQTDVHGQTKRAVSSGHLADTKKLATYILDVADWQQGLTIGYFKPNGKYFLEVIHIQDGEGVFHGRLIKGK